jgi:outer membrane protein TolC
MKSLLLSLGACLVLAAPAPAQEAGSSLTLDDAIHLALQHNRSLRVTSYSKGISRANLLVARGQFDPALVVGRSTAQNFTPDSTGGNPLIFERYRSDYYSAALQGQTPLGTTYNLGANETSTRFYLGGTFTEVQSFGGLSVTQPLLKNFGPDANLAGVRIAKANRDISDYEYRQSAISTVTGVVNAYSSLQFAHDALDVARRTRELAASLLGDNEKSLKIGSIAQSDVIQARSLFASLEENVLIYERQVRDAENALRELIGEDEFFEDRPLFTIVPVDIPKLVIDRRADLETALRMRPDFEIARLGIVQRKATESAARNGLLPEVDFVGGYGYNGLSSTLSASRQMVGDRLNPSFSAGVTVTLPLTYSVARGTARAARLQREQAEEDLARLRADIALGVATAEGQIETSRKRVSADQAAYALAKQALEAEEKKKRAGASTTLAVEQEQQNLAQVEFSVSAALASERQAVAGYFQELGVTLERYNIKLEPD